MTRVEKSKRVNIVRTMLQAVEKRLALLADGWEETYLQNEKTQSHENA